MLVTFDAKVKKDKKQSVNASTTASSHFLRENLNVIEDSVKLQKLLKCNRSKNGCLTCKTRKKKCNEAKPTCSNCFRLKRECIWVDPQTMTAEQIDEKRKHVEKSNPRLRRPRWEKKERDSDATGLYTSHVSATDSPFSTEPSHAHFGITLPETVFQRIGDKSTPLLELPMLEYGTNIEPLQAFSIYNLDFNLKQEQGDKIEDYKDVLLQPYLDRSVGLDVAVTSEIGSFAKENTPTLSDFLRDIGFQPSSDASRITTPTSNSTFTFPELLEQAGNRLSPSLVDQFVSSFATSVASPQHGPSIIPALNQKGFFLYEYYVETLSRKISIAPTSQDESNSYQKVFLPLAHKDEGVLFALLAWSCFALGGKWTQEGMQYIDAALKHLEAHHSHGQGRHAKSRDLLIFKLASLLIMCSAEICRGDVKRWPLFLSWGLRILADNGGIFKFNNDKEERWLITDFAYHDLLASSLMGRRPYFPTHEYGRFFKMLHPRGQSGLNPLLGVSKMLYPMIGDISTMAFESRRASERMMRLLDSDLGGAERTQVTAAVQQLLEKCRRLDTQIDAAKPEVADLVNLTDQELEHQLSIFETFQLTAKLFLRQAVLRCAPRHLESQLLTIDLLKCIDILIDTPAQASLVFPVFMAGIHAFTEKDRITMVARIDRFLQSYAVTNIDRVRTLVEQIWKENPTGDVSVDWFRTLEKFEWDLNFC